MSLLKASAILDIALEPTKFPSAVNFLLYAKALLLILCNSSVVIGSGDSWVHTRFIYFFIGEGHPSTTSGACSLVNFCHLEIKTGSVPCSTTRISLGTLSHNLSSLIRAALSISSKVWNNFWEYCVLFLTVFSSPSYTF